MSPDDQARRRRAAERAGRMVLHKTTLSDREVDFSPVCGATGISLLTQLSRESWSLTGQETATYSRERVPVRFIRRSAR